MKVITVVALSALLVACDGAKVQLIKKLYENRVSNANAGTILSAGTLISWGCDGYTRLNEVADGQGGSTTESVDRSPDCGWNPPEAGTVSETRCEDPYTLVTVFNDGEYGFYEEEEEKSEECGYVPPQVEPVKETGDRFAPVVFSYESLLDEEPVLEVTLGRASFEDGQILVRGSGATGEGILSVDGEEYQYTIVPEPRCGVPDDQTSYDCQGYRYAGPMKGYIYYGEDDDRIVEWEVGIVYYTTEECISTSEGICISEYAGVHEGITITHEEGGVMWQNAQRRVDKYNEAMERSGIHIRYVLKPGNAVDGHYHGPRGILSFGRIMDVDVVIGLGSTCEGTCGCAYVEKVFYENSNRVRGGVSACGWNTDLHEIGHGVGLAHGPENSANQATGYIWPDFGHGWDSFCSYYADIMSYNAQRFTHHNSTLTCGDAYGSWGNSQIQNELDDPAGSREYADAAYHLNRIRYDVSLIHCEDDLCAESPASDQTEEPVEGELIQDKITDFEDGPERYIEFMNEMPRFRPERMKPTHQH